MRLKQMLNGKFLLCLGLILSGSLMGCRTANTSYYPKNRRSGIISQGLQMSLSVSMAHPADPGFDIAIQNVGDKDVCLNLGTMLANGKVMFPDKIELNLVDGHGKSRKLQLTGPGAISGRMDDYVVPLRAGSTYTVHLQLDQFWSPGTQEFAVQLKPGKYEVSAQFQGAGARTGNNDMEGMKLMNFWKGNLESNPVFIVE